MRYLTAQETRDLGVLLEVNRRLLHPRGLALEATLGEDGEARLRIQDHRGDPEGVYFDGLDDADREKALAFARLLDRDRRSTRRTRLGYEIQPFQVAA